MAASARVRYLVLELGVGAAVLNFVINGALAWAMFLGRDPVQVWPAGLEPVIAGELVGTCFLLPFLTTLIVTPLAARGVRRGRLAADARPLPRWVPKRRGRRGLLFGACTVVLVAPAALAGFALFEVDTMPLRTFLWGKAAFGAALSIPVTPLVGVLALRDARRA